MSLGSQFRALQSKTAAFRQDLFGTKEDGSRVQGRMEEDESATPFDCYFSPVRSQEQLDEAGFKDIHDTIVRVLKTDENCRAIVGKSIRLIEAKSDGTDLVVRISELGMNNVNPEHVLGCKNEF